MSIIDITGLLYNGMWKNKLPVEEFNHVVKKIELGGELYNIDIFNHMNTKTGTHLEGISRERKSLLSNSIIEKLIDIKSYILQIPYKKLKFQNNNPYITLDEIKKVEEENIPEGSDILISTGYGENWKNIDYIKNAVFLSSEAARYLIQKKPFLIGSDFPVWDIDENDTTYRLFIDSNILLLYPCVNLEKVKNFEVNLSVLPLNISDLKSGCMVRAAIEE